MKVLMINTVDTARNGITSVIFNCVRAMRGKEFIFDLVTKNEPDSLYVDEIESVGGKVFVVPRSIKRLPQYVSKIKRLVLENYYDIVHIHGNSGTCTIEAAVAKQAKCTKVIVHAHSSSCKYQMAHKVLKPILNHIIDGRVACSNVAGEFLFEKDQYVVLNNTIDVERYRYHAEWRQQLRRKHHVEQDALLIGHVGAFSYAKNHEFLVQMFQCVRRSRKDAVLLLIGEGENESIIRTQVQKLGLSDCVVFAGVVDNVNEYMSAFDCFVLPSRFEGLPLVLLEAQASGLSCVVSEAVSRMANVTNNMDFVGLDQTSEIWSSYLLSCADGCDRTKRSSEAIQKLIECGYNLNRLGDDLAKYYMDVCGK